MSEIDYGHIEVLISKVLSDKNISKNYLADKANLQRTQLNAYCNNKIKRIDFDVLSRICYVLKCDIYEVLKYYEPNIKEVNQDHENN